MSTPAPVADCDACAALYLARAHRMFLHAAAGKDTRARERWFEAHAEYLMHRETHEAPCDTDPDLPKPPADPTAA